MEHCMTLLPFFRLYNAAHGFNSQWCRVSCCMTRALLYCKGECLFLLIGDVHSLHGFMPYQQSLVVEVWALEGYAGLLCMAHEQEGDDNVLFRQYEAPEGFHKLQGCGIEVEFDLGEENKWQMTIQASTLNLCIKPFHKNFSSEQMPVILRD